MMQEKWFKCSVIGKTTERKGFIFKRTAYILALRIFHGEGETKTVSREVAYDQYCDVDLNKMIEVKMYSLNGTYWTFTKVELIP